MRWLSVFQEGDMSADLFNFHEVVSRLQEKEEEVLDYCKDVIDLHARNLELLYNSTREVDYDQEGGSLKETLNSLLLILSLPVLYIAGFLWLSAAQTS